MIRRRFILSAVALLALGVTTLAPVFADLAPGLSSTTFQQIDAEVDRAMQAYNAGNWKQFYADYAKTMAGIATEGAFKTLYTDKYKKEFGNFKSRKLNAAKTAVSSAVGVVMYDAEMDKGPAQLAVNVMNDGGKMKLMQVQFNKK